VFFNHNLKFNCNLKPSKVKILRIKGLDVAVKIDFEVGKTDAEPNNTTT